MIGIVKGTVMAKDANDYEFQGKKGISYCYDLYQKGETELTRVSCNNEQYAKVKEGSQVEVQVQIRAKDSYDGAVLKVRQVVDKQANRS